MSDTTTTQAPSQPELKRVIGPKLLLFFVIGDILGTGIYALTGKVSGEVGGAIWAPFLAAFVVALFTAGSYIELVGKYPKAAGAALYTNKAFGIHFLTFIVAFAVMSSGLTSASAAARAFGGDYLKEFVDIPTVLVAIVFIIAVALINFRGVSESVKANVVLTMVELSGLLLILGIGVWAVLNGDGEPSRLTEFEGDSPIPVLITGGAALAFFAFVGFEDSVNMAEEVKNPAKVFPRALLLGLGITGVIYLAVALTSSLLVPADVLSGSSGPLLEVVKEGWPGFPLKLFSLIALFAVTNSALINMLMASRLVYGMSHERILPTALGTVHPLRRTPWVAIVFTTLLALLLVATGDVADLGGTTSLLLLCVFTVVNIAVLVLRKDTVDHQHFRVPTFIPVLGAITCAYLATPLSGRDAEQYRTAAYLLVVGIVLYAINYLLTRRRGGTLARS
jgi:amino acid transporter